MRNVLSLFDLTPVEIERVFTITQQLKTNLANGIREPVLAGHVAALLFEKRQKGAGADLAAIVGQEKACPGDFVVFEQKNASPCW